MTSSQKEAFDMTHTLKTLNPYFSQVWDGLKAFEVRDTIDRTFQAGDKVILMEYDPKHNSLTYREITVQIDYVLLGEDLPALLLPDVCVFGFTVLDKKGGEA
jgi:Domain of unknown function (DUF3850)